MSSWLQWTAGGLIVSAGVFQALLAVVTSYLENNGCTWLQVLFAENLCFLVFISFFWVISFAIQFKRNDEYNSRNTFISFLFSIFPPLSFSKIQEWVSISLASIGSFVAAGLQMLSIVYISSGNAVLLQTFTSSFCNIIFGALLFGESVTIYICAAFAISVIGAILVIQPSFIFDLFGDSDVYKTLSPIGVFTIVLSGMFRSVIKVAFKRSSHLDLHWLSMVVIPKIFAVVMAFIFSIGALLIYNSAIIYTFEGNDNFNFNDEQIIKLNLSLWTMGLFLIGWYVCTTFAYRIGNIGRLGVLTNIEIVSSFLLQWLLLGESENYLTYIGAVLIIIGCVIVFYDRMVAQNSEIHEIGDEIGDNISDIESMDEYQHDSLSNSKQSQGSQEPPGEHEPLLSS